ncbi:hypothetical protein PR202_gb23614 [Eleusine coracana subsp. coracana]|uniref:SS18 N-terminal domain-containing protein n=1 Tax=Eleusine coracana subsp. coracana TaxID=191504 RepID=A0AAV5FKY1_ELECO|nr:hypothetical protein PR202_gb23614 [Eleusine coracana subsp. coracana]
MSMQPQASAMAPASGITTEQIQKYLDENKQLILAILENQNLGKLAECAQYQAQLQKNLLYLAAIADAQPQTAVSALRLAFLQTFPKYIFFGFMSLCYSWKQMAPPGASPGVGNYMSQVPMFPPRTPLTPQQMQEQQLQQQQAQLLNFSGQMAMRPGMVNGMPQSMQVQQTYAANPQPPASLSKQDGTSEPSGTESHRSTGADNDGGSD